MYDATFFFLLCIAFNSIIITWKLSILVEMKQKEERLNKYFKAIRMYGVTANVEALKNMYLKPGDLD